MHIHSQSNRLRAGRAFAGLVLMVTLFVLATDAAASPIYTLTPLVTDDQGALADAGFAPAITVDPNLINPWGISLAATSPFWVSNQGSNTSTLYDGEGTRFPDGAPLVVDIPHAGPPYGPTGQVFAGGSGLLLPNGNPGIFYFANLDGSISGWNPATGTSAAVVVPSGTHGPAIYTGLALATTTGGSFLYAANTLAGTVDVFDSDYVAVSLPAGAFDAGDNPDSLVPFNVQNIGGLLYVSYATSATDPDEASLGSGFVNVFTTEGDFVRRIESDQFSSPWGMTLAPDDFGDFSNALLIGNFSGEFGYINAFDATTGEFLGALLGTDENPLVIPFLWGLAFGNGVLSDEDDLYFAAGIGDEEHGLFGEIASAVPEPGTATLLLLGLLGLVASRQRRS